MKAETANELRAANLAWNAAGDYSFGPRRLFFDGKGEPLFYENMATGLIHKWFDADALHRMLDSWAADYRARDFDDVAWLAFQEAAFLREEPMRPALGELHTEFLESLSEDAREVLRLLDVPAASAPRSQSELEDRIRALLKERYGFDGHIVKPVDAKLHLGVALLAPVLRDKADGRNRGRVVASAGGHVMKTDGEEKRTILKRTRDKRAREKAAADRRMVEDLFGPSLLNRKALANLEAAVCTGNHAGRRLWIADGSALVGSAQTREGRELLSAAVEQQNRTEAFFARNRRLCESAAWALAHHLRDQLECDKSMWEHRQLHGTLEAGRAWRTDKLDDARVFARKAELDDPELAVWLLLDASGSRSDQAAIIAAQAWVLAQGLHRAGVRVQVRSFSSLHGYTVVRHFEAGSDGSFPSVLRYFAAGMNRDGLALRVVGRESLEQTRKAGGRGLILVLTDAAPLDDAPFPTEAEPGLAGRAYVGKPAVEDAANEVRVLRAQGVGVAALYHGDDAMLSDCKQMFGSSFIRVRNLSRMADAAARLIANEARR